MLFVPRQYNHLLPVLLRSSYPVDPPIVGGVIILYISSTKIAIALKGRRLESARKFGT